MTGHSPSPGRSRSAGARLAIAAAATAAGLVLLAVWLLGGADDGDTAPAGAADSSGPAAAHSALRLPAADAGSPSMPDGSAVREAVEPLLGAAPPAPAPVPAARTAPATDAITLRGRVVDEAGQPVAGATVLCVPNAATQRLRGLHFLVGLADLSDLARTTTDGHGRFELEDRSVPIGHVAPALGAADVALDADPTLPMTADSQAPFPILAVFSDRHAPNAHVCRGLRAGDYDAGEIAVETGGRLTGRVVDETGRAVAGASVAPQRPKLDLRFPVANPDGATLGLLYGPLAGVTGDDGRFDVGPLWNGVTHLGLYEASHRSTDSGPHEVTGGEARDVGDLLLVRGLPIAGIVVDPEGRPVAGARVFAGDFKSSADGRESGIDSALHELRDFVLERPQVTGADGRFAIGSASDEEHRLFVDAPHFDVKRLLDLQPPVADLRIELEPAATLQLSVVDDASGAPLPDAIVRAVRRREANWTVPTDGRLPVVRARDAAGGAASFVIERLGRIRTDVVVSAPGHAPSAFTLEGVAPGTTLTRVERLARGLTISGRVSSAGGAPIAGALVTARPAGAEGADAHVRSVLKGLGYVGSLGPADPELPLAALVLASPPETLSAEDGAYALRGVAPGDWTVIATLPGHQPSERAVTVTAGASVEAVDLLMEESGTIFGRALDDEGRPDRGAHVTARSEPRPHQPAAGAETFTDLHGEYELRDLRPGTWSIGSGRKGTKQSVEVAAGARVRVDLAAELSASVSGRVLLDGDPVAGSVVTALRTRTPDELAQHKLPPGWQQTTRASATGEFALKLRPGEWTLQAGGGQPALGLSETVSFVVGPRDQRRVDLVFGGAAVSGRVTDAQSGEPIAGANVGLAPPDPPGKPNVSWIGGSFAVNDPDAWPRTDAQGRFVIPHVPPGEYSLTAAHPEFESQRLQSIALGGSDAHAELSIELERRTGIRATVERASGAALGPGYTLSVLRAEGGGKAKGLPIEAGQSKFVRLAPGDWTVRLLEPSKAEVASQSITLAEGEQRSLTFVVQP